MAVQKPKDDGGGYVYPSATDPDTSFSTSKDGDAYIVITFDWGWKDKKTSRRHHKQTQKPKLAKSNKINVKLTPAPKGPNQSLGVEDGVLQEPETQTTAIKPGPPKESIKSQPGLLEQIVGEGDIPQQRRGIPELYVEPGFVAQNYHAALGIAEDSNERWGDRAAFGLAGAGLALPWLAEEAGRSVLNVPYYTTYALDNLAGAVQANDWFSAVIYGLGTLEGTGEVANGALSAGIGSWPTPSRGSISTRSLSPKTRRILENFDEDATGLVSRIPKGANIHTIYEQVGDKVYEIIHSGNPVNPTVKAQFFEAVQVFPSRYQSLESVVVIDTYSILTPKGKYIRGLTVFDDLGEATVYLTRDADFLTYLDEGGHIAGARGRFDSHQRIYGYLNGPGGSQKFADYLQRQGVPPEAQQQYFEKAKARLDRAIKEKR